MTNKVKLPEHGEGGGRGGRWRGGKWEEGGREIEDKERRGGVKGRRFG